MTVKGGIMAWGGGSGATPRPLNVGHRVASITCSDSTTLLLTISGSLLICQDPSQLPHFQTLVDNRDKQGKEIVAAAVGMDHCVALTQEGRLLVWSSYPPHTQGTTQPTEMDVPGGKQNAVFIACGSAHSVAIISHKKGTAGEYTNGTSAITNEHSIPNGINGYTGMNGSGGDGDTPEDIFSDSTTQQTIARLRSKLAATPTRSGSPLRSPTPSTPTPPNPSATQPSLYSRQSISLLSSKISALSSFNHSKRLEENSLNSSGKRQSLTLPSSLTPFSWKSSASARRHSDLDSDDVGLPKHVKQSLFTSEDTPFGEELDTGSNKGAIGLRKFRGVHDFMRDSTDSGIATPNESRISGLSVGDHFDMSEKLEDQVSTILEKEMFKYSAGRSTLSQLCEDLELVKKEHSAVEEEMTAAERARDMVQAEREEAENVRDRARAEREAAEQALQKAHTEIEASEHLKRKTQDGVTELTATLKRVHGEIEETQRALKKATNECDAAEQLKKQLAREYESTEQARQRAQSDCEAAELAQANLLAKVELQRNAKFEIEKALVGLQAQLDAERAACIAAESARNKAQAEFDAECIKLSANEKVRSNLVGTISSIH